LKDFCMFPNACQAEASPAPSQVSKQTWAVGGDFPF
jgi:hypothetical protein